jgi:hypothetical protein
MAHAIQHRKISITLELDEDEAATLLDVTSCIGGLPSSRRRFMTAIQGALENAGVAGNGNEDIDPNNSALYFTV